MRRVIRNHTKGKSNQESLYTVTHELLQPSAIDDTFLKRASTCFSAALVGHGANAWPLASAALARLKRNIKTWAIAWAILIQMGEACRRKCLLGCKLAKRRLREYLVVDLALDETAHYLVCPALWATIYKPIDDCLWPPARALRLTPHQQLHH